MGKPPAAAPNRLAGEAAAAAWGMARRIEEQPFHFGVFLEVERIKSKKRARNPGGRRERPETLDKRRVRSECAHSSLDREDRRLL
jgi:hypothetical protein